MAEMVSRMESLRYRVYAILIHIQSLANLLIVQVLQRSQM